jgi:hypothetical protein
LPDDYPEAPPELRFLSEVYHPIVEPGTGKVDLGAVFPKWTPGRDYASFVLPHLHKALLRREYFAGSARQPLNPEARDLFLADPAAFAERAAECASASISKAQDPEPKFSMQFKGPTEAHDEILHALRDIDPAYSVEDQKAMFVDWFLDTYSHKRVLQEPSPSQAEPGEPARFAPPERKPLAVVDPEPQSEDGEKSRVFCFAQAGTSSATRENEATGDDGMFEF